MTSTTALPTGTWQIDTAATTVTVTVKKLGVLTVPASLTVTSGTIEIDDDNNVTDVEIVADASSYASKNPKRNEHVVNDDFLDAATHPTITFRASAVATAPTGYSADGTVTVKGKTSPVSVAITGVSVQEAAGSFDAAATVDRKSIGVDKMPTFVIGRDLDITVSAVVNRAS